jgi:hypothetical protein
MKLFVCNRQNQKIYIDIIAPTRRQLASIIGSQHFFIDRDYYTVNQVFAESENNDAVGGAVLGGLVGLLGGPVGLFFGGLAGGLIGKSRENDDETKVDKFNRSQA